MKNKMYSLVTIWIFDIKMLSLLNGTRCRDTLGSDEAWAWNEKKMNKKCVTCEFECHLSPEWVYHNWKSIKILNILINLDFKPPCHSPFKKYHKQYPIPNGYCKQ